MAIDKVVDSTILDGYFEDIADAIRAKDGSQATLAPAAMPQAIANIPTGGGEVSEKDVNFYDYDGTVIASYTAAEFAQLTAMPANPTHAGLTAQGWNWSLSDAKTYVQNNGKLNIGQMYVTTSGDTEIDIHIADIARNAPYLAFAVNGTAVIDWGDGSTTDTVTGTSLTTQKLTQHTYSAIGNYTIKISVTSGSVALLGNTSKQSILGDNVSTYSSRVYSNMVKTVRIGTGVTKIGDYSFNYCYSLQTITIPSSVTSIGQSAFNYCYSLESVTIPNNVTSISQYTFNYCYSLQKVAIPNSVTIINNDAFERCYSLQTITIPGSVTSIGNMVFNQCCSLESVTIPSGVTSIGYNTFSECNSLQTITIPSSMTSINSSILTTCSSLASVTIPAGVTSINQYAFSGCGCVKEYHLKPTTPPTLVNINAFQNIPSDCVIYVPEGTLEDYQTETNWTTYASYMQEE